jgi:RND family efflux transporter MFP subunit
MSIRLPVLRLAFAVLAPLALLLAFADCGPALAQGGPMPVTVARPVSRKVVETADFTGRFQASASVQISSRVTGQLQTASFTEGALVKAGDVLFTIDPRPFQAAVDQAVAELTVAQTKLDLSRTNLARSEELRRTGNVTDATFQANQQAFLEAQANIQAATAAITTAKLDLEFSKIQAPITGKIGRKLVNEGNLVVANSTTPLTTIVAVDPVYFYFDIDEASYLSYRRENGNVLDDIELRKANIALQDETGFSHPGVLDYVDPQIDNATGTTTARAVVGNADGFLTPGLFGRIRVKVTAPYDALVLPSVAIGTTDKGSYVVTVAADGTVAIKPVQAGPTFGEFRVVKSGLDPNDQVVVNGLMRARPGGKVIPQPTDLKVPEDLATANAPPPPLVP